MLQPPCKYRVFLAFLVARQQEKSSRLEWGSSPHISFTLT
nr:MAG TPA: hypothetical protein [Caudoviricetes sp.]